MAFVGNIIWLVLFGWMSFLLWAFTALFLALTVIGIPHAIASWRFAKQSAWPFGYELVDVRLLGEKRIAGTGFANFLWIIFAGIWLAIYHVFAGITCFMCFFLVVTIPCGLAHFKLAQGAFAPLGKKFVSTDVAKALKNRAVDEELREKTYKKEKTISKKDVTGRKDCEATPAPTKRPKSVTIIAACCLMGSVTSFFAMLKTTPRLSIILGVYVPVNFSRLVSALVLVLAVYLSYGLFRQKALARKIYICVSVFSILQIIISNLRLMSALCSSGELPITGFLIVIVIGVTINGYILYYLIRRKNYFTNVSRIGTPEIVAVVSAIILIVCVWKKEPKMEFVWIPPGEFIMGTPIKNIYGAKNLRESDEIAHTVTISDGFYMQTTEVTQAQWFELMGDNPSYFKRCGSNCPVEQVSWNDVQTFINRLSEKKGHRYRLPTEAEWEYACRGGNDSLFCFGDNPGSVKRYGWLFLKKTYPVAQKDPNQYGLYDMYGNVSEWCQDYYGTYPSDRATNPSGPSVGSKRVHRGGSWKKFYENCRSASRFSSNPASRRRAIGFRLVKEPGKTE